MSVPSEIFRCEEEILHEKYCFGNKQTKNKIEKLEGLYHECVQQCIHLSTNAFCNSGYFLQTSAMLMMVHCVIYLHYCCIVPWKINFHSCSYDMEYGYHQNTVLDYLPGHTHRAESNIQCFAILTSICISLCIYNGYVFNMLFYPTNARKYFVKTQTYVALFGPHELSLIFSGGMCLELTSL